MPLNYRSQTDNKCLIKLNHIMERLPDYVNRYIISTDNVLMVRSRLGYAQDLEIFLYFIAHSYVSDYIDNLKEIPINYISERTPEDIQDYLQFLNRYEFHGKIYTNGASSKKRKLAAVRELYKFLCLTNRTTSNPAALVRTPKEEYEKVIRVLDAEEKQKILNVLESEEGLSKKELETKPLQKQRDIAIYQLLLGTGIRISELVGLDIEDVNLDLQYIITVQKGGRINPHYFSDVVRDSLENYLVYVRPKLNPIEKETAFFISRRGTRLSVRSIQKILKDSSIKALGSKKSITPHKLRSTFGSNLYKQSGGDLGLVQDNLGHSDISTTRRYYASQDQERLKLNKDFDIYS